MDIMKKSWTKKVFQVIPGACVIPLSCLFTSCISSVLLWYAVKSNQLSLFVICGLLVFFIGGLIGVETSIQQTMCCVEFCNNHAICYIPFGRQIQLEYSECNIGMDYHTQNGTKIWWIYLCYGSKPRYQTKGPTKRMNTLKCKPGFIRIMYREEVYDALISVLPKKQRIALETSRRCAGFEKQGRII